MGALGDIRPQERTFDARRARGMPLPWWGKIGAKLLLSRVLPSYGARKRLGIFRHGARDTQLDEHHRYVTDILARHAEFGGRPAACLLELGPGDSLGTSVIAASQGVQRTFHLDVGDFATTDMGVYRAIVARVEATAPGFAKRVDLSDRTAMLRSLDSVYLTRGMADFAQVPSGIVDLVVSTSVLEHVHRAQFASLVSETFRVLRPGGTARHFVDFMDHLGGALNNLRFSEAVWEHPSFAASGFYTNRLRPTEVEGIMRAAGFETALLAVERWPDVPTPREVLAQPFRSMSEDDLRIASFDILLRKPVEAASHG